MGWMRLLLATLVCACGSPHGETTEAAADAADAAPDAFIGWHVEGAVLPPLLEDRDDPTLTPEMDEMLFDQNGVLHVTHATGTGWTEPVVIAELNTQAETACELTGDGLGVYFASKRAGGAGSYDIWYAQRASRTSPWLAPQRVAELSSSSVDLPGGISGNGLVFVLISDRQGNADIYLSTRSAVDQPWSTPTRAAELSTEQIEQSAWLSADGTEIYFDRVSGILHATRATPTSSFSTPELVNELGGRSIDPWVSPDGRDMYFAAGTPLAIYHATRGL
jgi:hypothetical protein